MATRIFALIIGIDRYKSANIWNLETCVQDACSIEDWLTAGLHVPRHQISLLLNQRATKHAIEDEFMRHLVNNPAIEHGDPILIYFAGHGSSLPAPRGWYADGLKDVELLCPYDHDTKNLQGRIAGISDRSMQAMLRDLYQAKGDNITLVLDCCFSPPSSSLARRDRRHTRWTPTNKSTPDDLYTSLWRSALAQSVSSASCRGFAKVGSETHVVLAACKPGQKAVEGKSGGDFTQALLSVTESEPLHSLSTAEFAEHINSCLPDDQIPLCVGKNKDQELFQGVPFHTDSKYISIGPYDRDDRKIRIDAGAIHGVTEGTEFSLHHHNRHGSINPVVATCFAAEVYPTWCLARPVSRYKSLINQGWACVTKWNNPTPFKVHIRTSFFSLCRSLRLRRLIPSKPASDTEAVKTKSPVNMTRVHHLGESDISVKPRRRELTLERRDGMISSSDAGSVVHIASPNTSFDLTILDAAAHFHHHLHTSNPAAPLQDLVTMELYQLDSGTWLRVSGNLLVNGKAHLVDEGGKQTIYAVVLHNHSDVDLWPYLTYMDASAYGVSVVYHPEKPTSGPPLKKHSHLVIGTGTPDSEALCFSLVDGANSGAGFLKLFLSTSYTLMTSVEQRAPETISAYPLPLSPPSSLSDEKASTEMWDTVTASVTVSNK